MSDRNLKAYYVGHLAGNGMCSIPKLSINFAGTQFLVKCQSRISNHFLFLMGMRGKMGIGFVPDYMWAGQLPSQEW